MRNQIKFSKFGSILQEETLEVGEEKIVFSLKMPDNYVGFLYYLANNSFPLELNIDGEKINVKGIIAPINSPKYFNPPFVVNKSIEVKAINKDKQGKKISFYADGTAYSILTMSEEILVNEIKGKKGPKSQQTDTAINVKEIIPTTAHIINHNLHDADKWYEIKLPRDIVTWAITVRGSHEIQYSYSPTHQNYRTLRASEILEADTSPNAEINAIYVMSEEGGVVVELECWRK